MTDISAIGPEVPPNLSGQAPSNPHDQLASTHPTLLFQSRLYSQLLKCDRASASLLKIVDNAYYVYITEWTLRILSLSPSLPLSLLLPSQAPAFVSRWWMVRWLHSGRTVQRTDVATADRRMQLGLIPVNGVEDNSALYITSDYSFL